SAAHLLKVAPSRLEAEVVGARKSGLLGLGAPKLDVLLWVPKDAAAPESGSEETAPTAAEEDAPAAEAEPKPTQVVDAWSVRCQSGECYLQVRRPGPWLPQVEERVRPWPLDDYQREAVRDALAASSGRPVRIGSITPPENADPEAPFFVKVTPDSMSAWIVPARDGGVTPEQMFESLERAGVEWGIQEQAIQAAAGQPLVEPLLAASGSDPTPSCDAAVEYLFAEEDELAPPRPLLREDGSVDHHELTPIYTVQPGTLVGRYLPAVAGQPGRNVFGQEQAPASPGHDIPAQRFAGHDVAVAENGIDLVATKAGRPIREEARIDIVDVHTVAGDVDYSTGNVDFQGDVYVMGDVQPGFSVRASGDVRINGMVDSANVDVGRDLLIAGGIYGHGESKLACGRHMTARFIDAATVSCEGNLTVLSTIVRSTVTCRGQVTVMGRGTIVGGKIKAVAGITCTAAGSASGAPTSLELDWISAIHPGPERDRELARYRIARITVYADVFPGTTVTINGAKFPVRDHLREVCFRAADRGIALSPLR
ncbi:MAG TPA: FapA family protein, partial [Chloroflexota bacterium]|nr:FapA family protein [Chloroflexota bacterium]